MVPIPQGIDENFVAYIRDGQSGKLVSGQYAFYDNGQLISQGSYENMGKLFDKEKSLGKSLGKLLIKVDSNLIKCHDLKSLEKILEDLAKK